LKEKEHFEIGCTHITWLRFYKQKASISPPHRHVRTQFTILFHYLRSTTEPAYGIFVLGSRPKKQQFLVALPTP